MSHYQQSNSHNFSCDYSNSDVYLRRLEGRNYFSQAAQDLFVLSMLQGKKHGYYIEIGGSDPFESNNTFLLEKDYLWKGFSLEIDSDLASKYNSNRLNYCICADAVNFDYIAQMAKLSFPAQVDYLSVDIDPPENTFNALLKSTSSTRFSVITFEHDLYSHGGNYAELARSYLNQKGYILVIKNVKCFGRIFEDWYIDPGAVPMTIWQEFVADEVEFCSIFR